MKILHLPDGYLPWTTGGREVYCHSLCRALTPHGFESVVALHGGDAGAVPTGLYRHEDIPVRVLPPLPRANERESWYSREFDAIPGFADLLDELQPDLVHFHDQGGGASLSHLKLVKARNLPAVITYHSPGQTCPESELLRGGSRVCDGEVRIGRCTACRLKAAGMPTLPSALCGAVEWPSAQSWSKGRIGRLLSARTMTRLFRNALGEFIRSADVIVVLAEWSRQVWLRNGCPADKLKLVRTGATASREIPAKRPRKSGPLRIACIGRCEKIKGFQVVVEAVRSIPAIPLEVHFFGPYWNNALGARLTARMRSDSRFRAPRLLRGPELAATLADIDVVVIPSLWLETGPLSLFDAFAAGLPVVASALGGMAEIVADRVDGLLFSAGNSAALAAILAELAGNPFRLSQLKEGVRHRLERGMRNFDDIAVEMASIYSGLVSPSGRVCQASA